MLSSQPGRSESYLEPLSVYWTFYREVAARQLAAWLPAQPVRILDLSGTPADSARQAATAGHDVIRVIPAGEGTGGRTADGVRAVVADTAHLSFLAGTTVDAVIAEQLSSALATESTVADVARVLRPGGRLLLRVDSLLLGMARLAQQQHWAVLSDAPSAEVLLVPSPDGSITRCFWPAELHELLTDAGLEPEWIRPRTVLSPSVVQRVLAEDPSAFDELVRTELSLPQDRADESVGIHLLASAKRAETPH